jgi:hypothetical protein
MLFLVGFQSYRPYPEKDFLMRTRRSTEEDCRAKRRETCRSFLIAPLAQRSANMSLFNATANGMEEKTAAGVCLSTIGATIKMRDELKEYHILTFGRTDKNVRLSIVISLVTLIELHKRCQMLAVLQPRCTRRACKHKPETCLTMGVQPRDKAQTYTVVMNFPVCGDVKCAKWLLERHEVLVDQIFKKSLGRPVEELNKDIRLFIENPDEFDAAASAEEEKIQHKKARLRKKKREQNKRRRAVQTQAQETVDVGTEQKPTKGTTTEGAEQKGAADTPSAPAAVEDVARVLLSQESAEQLVVEAKIRVGASQNHLSEANGSVCINRNPATENASMRAEDLYLPRHPLVRCDRADRMPLDYRQQRPIPHTALARKLHQFFAHPSFKWDGRLIWRDVV